MTESAAYQGGANSPRQPIGLALSNAHEQLGYCEGKAQLLLDRFKGSSPVELRQNSTKEVAAPYALSEVSNVLANRLERLNNLLQEALDFI